MLLDPAACALDNMRRVQASSDAQPARCMVAGRGVRVIRASLAPDFAISAQPAQGEAVVFQKHLLLGCSDGTLEVLEVKPDGKRQMTARDFAAGLQGKNLNWKLI